MTINQIITAQKERERKARALEILGIKKVGYKLIQENMNYGK